MCLEGKIERYSPRRAHTGQYELEFQCSYHHLALVPREGDRLEVMLGRHFMILKGHIRNGPPLVGRLEKLTWKVTPTPLGPAVAEMLPLTLPRGS